MKYIEHRRMESSVMNETNVEDRMITALEFINRITEEYGDDDDEEDF